MNTPAVHGCVQRGEGVRLAQSARSARAQQTETGLFWAYDRPGHRRAAGAVHREHGGHRQRHRQHAGRQRADVRPGVGHAGRRDHRGLGRPSTRPISGGPSPASATRRTTATPTRPPTRPGSIWAPRATTPPSRPTISRRRSPPTSPATPRWAAPSSSRWNCSTARTTSPRPTPRSAAISSTAMYTLHSTEPGSGDPRDYVRFTQDGPLGPGLENSPEGENSMSRVYLGVHWRMDQEDGQALGRAVAQYVADNYFQAVPEPSVAGACASCASRPVAHPPQASSQLIGATSQFDQQASGGRKPPVSLRRHNMQRPARRRAELATMLASIDRRHRAHGSRRPPLSAPPFVHLHCHSHYSLLDGASPIKGLVARAKELGMNALALTDHGNLYGAARVLQGVQGRRHQPDPRLRSLRRARAAASSKSGATSSKEASLPPDAAGAERAPAFATW